MDWDQLSTLWSWRSHSWKSFGKTFEVTKNSRMWLHSPCVAECLKQRDSSKRDIAKSSGAVAWAFGSPSFVRIWMLKEPRQCRLSWVGIDKGDADQPNCRSRSVMRDQEGHEEVQWSFCSWTLQRNATSGGVKALHSLFFSTVKKRRKASEKCLWNSQMKRKRGSHVRTDTIWNTLACWESAQMARQCSLASSWRTDPERTRFRPRSQQSLSVCAHGTRCSTARSRWRLRAGRCPVMKRNGSQASCSRSTMESARVSSIQMATLRWKLRSWTVWSGGIPHLAGLSQRLAWGTLRWCFAIWNGRTQHQLSLLLSCVWSQKNLKCWQVRLRKQRTPRCTALSRCAWTTCLWTVQTCHSLQTFWHEGWRVPRRNTSRTSNVLDASWLDTSCEGDQLERSACSYGRVTFDQAWERGAKHHNVEQLRIWVQCVAQILSMHWYQSNAECLALRCETRDSHALWQQRGKSISVRQGWAKTRLVDVRFWGYHLQ